MTRTGRPADQPAREQIATDLTENLFVEAGAGTGKTTALVGRMVALVLDREMPVEAIVAITFTERAATELRDRFRLSLEAVARSETDGNNRLLAEQALADVDLAAISTLHGFARRILAEHPLEAGLPPTFELLDEVTSRLTFDDRWNNLEHRLLDDPALSHTLLLAADLDITLDHLRDLAKKLDENWDLLSVAKHPPPEPAVKIGSLLEALAAITIFQRGDLPADDKLQIRLDAVEALQAELTSITDDFAMLALLQSKRGRSTLTFGNPGAVAVWGETKDEIIAAKKVAIETWDTTLIDVSDQVLQRLLHELIVGTRTAAEERRHAGVLTFHDLLVDARDLLADPDAGPEVRASLNERYQAILLDEFQDTDPVQLELALMIADPVSRPAAPLDEVSPAGGSVFMVGDPKQSIYRFRRADIALYLKARRSLPTTAVALTENFRTTTEVINWINAVFSTLIEANDGQPEYVPLVGRRSTPSIGSPVTLLGASAHNDLKAADLRALEATDVATAIKTAVAEGWTVEASDGGERACTFADIAVLIPSRTSLLDLENALDEVGIPYRAESSSLLFGTPEIRDLLLILRAIDDPLDDLAIVHALRTPYLGCGDDDLARWRLKFGGSWNHQDPPLSNIPSDNPVATGLAWLGELHRTRHHQGPSAILERLITERRVLELATATTRPREVWRRVRLLTDQARAFAEASGGSIRAFVDWSLQQAQDGSQVTETVLPELDDDAVRILTIHGAKGLEFPITVVSGLSGAGKSASTDVDLLFGPEGNPEAKIRKTQATHGYAAAEKAGRAFDLAERLRLLYVATTRARDHLIVSLYRSDDEHGKPADGATPARQIAAAIAALGTNAPANNHLTATSKPLPAPVVLDPPVRPERNEWKSNRRATITAASGRETLAATMIAAHVAPELPVDRARPGEAGRHGTAVGRAVHGALEHASFDTDDIDFLAKEHAVNEGVADTAPLIASLIRSALKSDVVQRAANSRHWRELYVAAPLFDDPAAPVVEGFIDLAFLDERSPEPGLVIVDYKTDAVIDTTDRLSKVERYRLQGATYALAAQTCTGLPVHQVVFCFLAEEGAVELEIEDLAAAMAEVALVAHEITGR
ncbi:MAG: UvrD-helicase domain-containing protein [Acidimicrobiales bacterium]|nr:UvrD-helicase domain-containing protein [Acidimicrobiales bacterium]